MCEGAGSPAEINLLDHDIVNLSLAIREGMPAVIVGDIDRGGVLAALYGTVGLLPTDLRRAVRGFVVNKFRGDPALLEPGLVELERRTGVPTLGVIPWIPGLGLDAEDSLGLATFADSRSLGDRRVLEARSSTSLSSVSPTSRTSPTWTPSSWSRASGCALVDRPGGLGDPDLIVLPGTKTTVEDLEWMRRTGLAAAVGSLARSENGPVVLGICGGYQMLGTSISDPEGVETRGPEISGLGWLPVTTVFGRRKVVARRRGVLRLTGAGHGSPVQFEGYEIHHGVTVP